MIRSLLSTLAIGPACCVLMLSGLLSAQNDGRDVDYEWGKALSEKYRYFDMAERIFDRMKADPDKTKKNLGLKGLASLKRAQALRSDDLEQRATWNAEAVESLREVSKNLRVGTNAYYETLFDLADILQDVATEATDQINLGRVPSDQIEAVQKENQNRLDEAEGIFNKIRSDLADKDEDSQPEEWFMGVRARLYSLTILLNKAELIATDPVKLKSPARLKHLKDALEGLDLFNLDYEGKPIGFYGYLWMGRVQQALFASKEPNVSAADVELNFTYVYSETIFEAMDYDADGNEVAVKNWVPPESFQDLAQRAVWWLFKFQNESGRTGEAVTFGKRFRDDWKKFKMDYNFFGRLALNELAAAHHAEGQSAEALELAAFVSEKGGFPGQEA
ncbi:MAG: hypothetical protein KDB53_09590, partial [Planctomycetes bacterium]|nr:hypothetical protein [Planctomycetota bacterium]